MQKSDRTLLQRFRRRLNFAVRYFEAKKRSKLIAKLLPILERSFDHPWVAGVELKIRFWPGNETKFGELRRVYKSLPAQSMHWDAPIAISVFRERKGSKKAGSLHVDLFGEGRPLHQTNSGHHRNGRPKGASRLAKDFHRVLAERLCDKKVSKKCACPRQRRSIPIAILTSICSSRKTRKKELERESNKVWSCYIMPMPNNWASCPMAVGLSGKSHLDMRHSYRYPRS